MKATTKQSPLAFSPIEMVITFESKRELELMRKIMNKSSVSMCDFVSGSLSEYEKHTSGECHDFTMPIYNEVTDILLKLK